MYGKSPGASFREGGLAERSSRADEELSGSGRGSNWSWELVIVESEGHRTTKQDAGGHIDVTVFFPLCRRPGLSTASQFVREELIGWRTTCRGCCCCQGCLKEVEGNRLGGLKKTSKYSGSSILCSTILSKQDQSTDSPVNEGEGWRQTGCQGSGFN